MMTFVSAVTYAPVNALDRTISIAHTNLSYDTPLKSGVAFTIAYNSVQLMFIKDFQDIQIFHRNEKTVLKLQGDLKLVVFEMYNKIAHHILPSSPQFTSSSVN